MTPRWLLRVSLAGAAMALGSCKMYYSETQTTGSPIYITSNMPSCRVREVALAVPTVAVFLGVSAYGDRAGVFSTPAHFIGANMVAGLFGYAGDKAGAGTYSSTTLSDILPKSQLPKDSADPMNVVSEMGYGGGGSQEFLERAKLKSTLDEAIAAAEKAHEKNGRVQLVIYVAAHGFLGPDGQPYFLPADAKGNDSGTWISYRSVVDSVQKFLAASPDGTRTALVIFDTCQITRDGARPTPMTFTASPGLVLVQSAAPGQYAWHWTGRSTMNAHVDVVKETRVGWGGPPKVKRGDIHQEIATTMSVLPLANQCSLSDTVKTRNLQPGAPDQVIGVREWFTAMKSKADGYLAQIPEMRELERTQEITITMTEADAARPLFIVQAPKAPEEKPKEGAQ